MKLPDPDCQWFLATYSQDVEIYLQAYTWQEALAISLDRANAERGHLEVLELADPLNLTPAHPSSQ